MKILQFLAPLLKAGIPQADVISLAKNFIRKEMPEPTSGPSGDAAHDTRPQTPQPPPFLSTPAAFPQMPPSQMEESHSSETMVGLLQSSSASEEDTVLELLHVVDTGGQPEFMEVLPSVMHNSYKAPD